MVKYNLSDLANGAVGEPRRREIVQDMMLKVQAHLKRQNFDQADIKRLTLRAQTELESIITYNKAPDRVAMQEYLQTEHDLLQRNFENRIIIRVKLAVEQLNRDIYYEKLSNQEQALKLGLEDKLHQNAEFLAKLQASQTLANLSEQEREIAILAYQALQADQQYLQTLQLQIKNLENEIIIREAIIAKVREKAIKDMAGEIVEYFKKLGIHLSKEEAVEFSEALINIKMEEIEEEEILEYIRQHSPQEQQPGRSRTFILSGPEDRELQEKQKRIKHRAREKTEALYKKFGVELDIEPFDVVFGQDLRDLEQSVRPNVKKKIFCYAKLNENLKERAKVENMANSLRARNDEIHSNLDEEQKKAFKRAQGSIDLVFAQLFKNKSLITNIDTSNSFNDIKKSTQNILTGQELGLRKKQQNMILPEDTKLVARRGNKPRK